MFSDAAVDLCNYVFLDRVMLRSYILRDCGRENFMIYAGSCLIEFLIG